MEVVAGEPRCLHTIIIVIIIKNAVRFVVLQGRKDFMMIFNNLLRRQIGSRYPTVDYICQHRDILTSLMTGYVII